MEAAAQREKKVKDGIYIPKSTLEKADEMAKALGKSRNEIWEMGIDNLYSNLETLLDLELRRRADELNRIKARNQK